MASHPITILNVPKHCRTVVLRSEPIHDPICKPRQNSIRMEEISPTFRDENFSKNIFLKNIDKMLQNGGEIVGIGQVIAKNHPSKHLLFFGQKKSNP